MRARWRGVTGSVLLIATVAGGAMAADRKPLPVAVHVDGDRFEITGEQNTLTGVRRAPVPYETLGALTNAVQHPAPSAAAARIVRSSPPQVIDYVLGVTDDGVLILGQQVRTLDGASGRYEFTTGEIMRAYAALEASVPWTWIVDIPLGREVSVTLEVTALSPTWPVRGVTVTPKVLR